jgi:hypothetical protein
MEFLKEPEVITAIISGLCLLASEVIGMNKKWKSNSIVQAIITGLQKVAKKK